MGLEIEKGFEEIFVFISLFLVLTTLVWLLFGNYQIQTNSIVLILFGLVSSGVLTWYLYK